VERCGLDACDSEQGPVVGCCENVNELSGSIKGGKFLDYLSDYYHLKDSVPWSYFVN
jgi:hypothetical protein